MDKHEPTPCCGYQANASLPYPVMWNPGNKVVQCHNCGQVYEPAEEAPIYLTPEQRKPLQRTLNTFYRALVDAAPLAKTKEAPASPQPKPGDAG